MSRKKTECDWIIAHDSTKGADAYMVECLRCGGKQRFVLPIAMEIWIAAAKAFQKAHKRCDMKSTDKHPPGADQSLSVAP
jgi:hypothetical protein